MTPEDPIEAYLRGGRRPWSRGYSNFKHEFIRKALADDDLMARFRDGGGLPEGYGPGLDERVVEYPWVIARLRGGRGPIMDAGSTFSTPLVLDLTQIKQRPLIIYTAATDWMDLRPNVSYIFGDLRETLLRDALLEAIACISTLEHIGMAPDPTYSMSRPYPGARPESYREALREFRRLLVPGGQLLLTVPFGRREDHGWLRQFDLDGVDDIVQAFGGTQIAKRFYRHLADGWRTATPEECADCRYYDVHATPEPGPDNAAAARAVACLELIRE